jgi:hypothetical protein
VPEVWVGRADLLPLHERERRDRVRGRYASGTVFIGPSGIGKSVLVNRFAEHAAEAGDVVLDPVRVAKRSDPIAHLATAIDKVRARVAGDAHLADSLEAVLRRLHVVSIKGVKIAVEDEGIANPHLVVRDSLIGLAEAIARENARRDTSSQRAVIIRIDELQNADNEQRSKLLSALGDVLEHEVDIDTGDRTGSTIPRHLPVLLYVTGLPDLLNRTTNVDTFRRRFDTIPLGVFTDGEVVDALLDTPLPSEVTFDRTAAEAMADIVAGDPFLFQLVGRHAWDASSGDQITPGDVVSADEETYGERLRTVEAAAADIRPGTSCRPTDAATTEWRKASRSCSGWTTRRDVDQLLGLVTIPRPGPDRGSEAGLPLVRSEPVDPVEEGILAGLAVSSSSRRWTYVPTVARVRGRLASEVKTRPAWWRPSSSQCWATAVRSRTLFVSSDRRSAAHRSSSTSSSRSCQPRSYAATTSCPRSQSWTAISGA